jgi:hypothetical protein
LTSLELCHVQLKDGALQGLVERCPSLERLLIAECGRVEGVSELNSPSLRVIKLVQVSGLGHTLSLPGRLDRPVLHLE